MRTKAIENYHRFFTAGEQFLVFEDQAKLFLRARQNGELSMQQVDVFLADSPKYEDLSFHMFKVVILNDGFHTFDDTPFKGNEPTWSHRVARIFNEAGVDHTLVVTNGEDTTPVLGKAMRHPMQMANPGHPVNITSVVISDEGLMYWGYMCSYGPAVERELKK